MKILGYILLACLVLAALRLAAILLLAVAAVGFVIALFTHPRETLGAIAVFGCLSLVAACPWVLVIIGIAVIVANFRSR